MSVVIFYLFTDIGSIPGGVELETDCCHCFTTNYATVGEQLSNQERNLTVIILIGGIRLEKVSDGFLSADLTKFPCSTAEISVTFLMYQNRPVLSEASVLS